MTTTAAVTKAGSTDLDAIKQEQAAMAKEREESKAREGRMRLVEGKNVVRILPPIEGTKSPFSRTYVHYIKNPSEPDKPGRPVVCPLKTRNAPCIVCQKVSALRRTGNEIDKKVAGDLSASRRIYANVVNLQEPDKGVQVLEFGTRIYEDLLGLLTDEEAGGDFTDAVKGYNIVIDRVGTTKENTKYTVRMAKQPTPLANKAWLGALRDLTKIVEPMDDERLQAIMEGRDPDAESPTGLPPVSDDDFVPAPGR